MCKLIVYLKLRYMLSDVVLPFILRCFIVRRMLDINPIRNSKDIKLEECHLSSTIRFSLFKLTVSRKQVTSYY